MKTSLIFTVTVAFALSAFSQEKDLKSFRTQIIIDAFNSKPENLVRPLTPENVELGVYDGRVNVNTDTKFSYYIHIANMNESDSPITLIPMATSRYTPTYYQTDDWWDAHKDELEKARLQGTPAPRQDMDEVAAWLKKMKLSTNPDVIEIDPSTNKVTRLPLQDFLYNHYMNNYVHGGVITLYRGAEKDGEIDAWNRKEVPRGARYWTPTANYAWRYARKNRQFLDELVIGKTPLFKFEIPVNDFEGMIKRQWQRLTLGTELTKNAHNSFDHEKKFTDHLANEQPYLGEGHYGVEFELRSNRAGAEEMIQYYKGPVGIEELAADRISVLELTRERLIAKDSKQKEKLKKKFDERIEQVLLEEKIIVSILSGVSKAEILEQLESLKNNDLEIADIDGLYFHSWVKETIELRDSRKIKLVPSTNYKGQCKKLF